MKPTDHPTGRRSALAVEALRRIGHCAPTGANGAAAGVTGRIIPLGPISARLPGSDAAIAPPGPTVNEQHPGGVKIAVIRLRGIIAGASAAETSWHGEIQWRELRSRHVPSLGSGRAAYHDALRSYFQRADGDPAGHLNRIGYQLPSLAAGDLIVIEQSAWVVTESGSFTPALDDPRLAALAAGALEPDPAPLAA